MWPFKKHIHCWHFVMSPGGYIGASVETPYRKCCTCNRDEVKVMARFPGHGMYVYSNEPEHCKWEKHDF